MDTSRPTDLNELDLHSLVEASLLSYDKQDSEFSGWIHVADTTSMTQSSASHTSSTPIATRKTRHKQQRLVFRKRFCRLRELICTFHESDAPVHAASPIAHHVVIAVERVHERNKTFALTDYEDRRVVLHTTLGADFEEWFAAFATAVRKTQVSKARAIEAIEDQHAELSASRHRAAAAAYKRFRSATASHDHTASSVSPADAAPSDRDSDVDVIDDEHLNERTHTAWLDLHSPWWKLRRRRVRRYCVLSGTTLSCFSVNKEGHLADSTHQLVALQYNAVRDPFAVIVRCASGKTLLLSRSTRPQIVQDWVAHLQVALDARSRRDGDRFAC